jgi:hypothetical protein
MRTKEEIWKELDAVQNEIDKLWWTFTRTAKGKPPVVVRPDLYTKRDELEKELRRRIKPVKK